MGQSSLKILVNGTRLLTPLTGIGSYIRHLFTAMQRMPEADLYMFYGTRLEKGVRLPTDSSRARLQIGYKLLLKVLPRPRFFRQVAEQAMFRFHTQNLNKEAIYHEPNYLPLVYKGPIVLTICDMSCFDHPEAHPKERVDLMQRHLPRSLERADHIIVISDATKLALKRWFDVADTRMTVTYLAADLRFMPRTSSALAPILSGLGLIPSEFILSVGTLEPRKNLEVLFAAYSGLPAVLRKRFPLVVAGMSGWNNEALIMSAKALINRGELRFLGYVPDDLMPALYSGAAVFCYPSRYEGFGLPALEAMASGVPVITSNQTSLPEVVGSAGLMTDPDDVTGLRERLQQLLEDRVYAHTLAQLGLQQAKTFSWERCAKETFSVYEKVRNIPMRT